MNDELVYKSKNGEAITNSLLVAKTFEKRHDKVLRDIRNLACSQEFRAANFGEASYLDAQGKPRPLALLNRDGFTLLVMGYTGNKAMTFKEEYIKEFNRKEAEIQNLKREANVQLQPKTPAEMFLMQAQMMVEQEKRLSVIENKIEKMEQEREENGRLLLEAQVSSNSVPSLTMRKGIIALVNEYSAAANISQQDVWHKIYADLYYKYGKSINNYKRLSERESKLEIAERNGLLQPMFDIISDMVSNFRKSA